MSEAATIPAVPPVLTMAERAVLDVLSGARGAEAAISIDGIQGSTSLSYRAVTGAIENLRVEHKLPIGSARGGARHGYYLIENAEDLEATVRPLKNQAFSMLKVVNSLEGPGGTRLAELVGQLKIELTEPEIENGKVLPVPVPARVRGTGAVLFADPRKTETCWHCQGSGGCNCAVCAERGQGLKYLEGRCAACLGTRRLTWVGNGIH